MCEITICFQARKKQLHRGKVPLLLCVVDSIDWHGCDLSVALKDRSGQASCSVVLNDFRNYKKSPHFSPTSLKDALKDRSGQDSCSVVLNDFRNYKKSPHFSPTSLLLHSR